MVPLCRWLLLIPLCGCVEERPGKKADPSPEGPTTGEATDTGTAPVEHPWLAVGTGELDHTPLTAPTDEILVVYGGQGGFHVEVSGEVHGLGEIVRVYTEVRRADTGALLGRTPGTAMRLDDWDEATRVGWFSGERAIFTIGALNDVCPLDGARLELRAAAEDLADPLPWAAGIALGTAVLDPGITPYCGTP